MSKMQCEKCGSHKGESTVFHAWRVKWDEIKPRLSDEAKELLKYKALCKDCKQRMIDEVLQINSDLSRRVCNG